MPRRLTRFGQGPSYKMEGAREMERVLGTLPDKLREKALQNAAVKAARVVRNEAKAGAPVETGFLRDNIVVSRSIKERGRRRKLIGEAVVGLRGGARFFGHLVEFGSSRQAAQPFLRPAFKTKFREALQVLINGVGSEMAKASRKLTGWDLDTRKRRRLTR